MSEIESEDDSMPNFGIDCKKNVIESQEDNKYRYGKTHYNANNQGLGFVQNEEIHDLNKAIDSLDNTQFRDSIKAGSDNNELS